MAAMMTDTEPAHASGDTSPGRWWPNCSLNVTSPDGTSSISDVVKAGMRPPSLGRLPHGLMPPSSHPGKLRNHLPLSHSITSSARC